MHAYVYLPACAGPSRAAAGQQFHHPYAAAPPYGGQPMGAYGQPYAHRVVPPQAARPQHVQQGAGEDGWMDWLTILQLG